MAGIMSTTLHELLDNSLSSSCCLAAFQALGNRLGSTFINSSSEFDL